MYVVESAHISVSGMKMRYFTPVSGGDFYRHAVKAVISVYVLCHILKKIVINFFKDIGKVCMGIVYKAAE